VSLAIWNHTVLPATRHKWAHPALTPAIQAGTRFTYPGRMEGWVDVDLGDLLHTKMVYPPADGHTYPSTNRTQCRLNTLIEANALTTTLHRHLYYRNKAHDVISRTFLLHIFILFISVTTVSFHQPVEWRQFARQCFRLFHNWVRMSPRVHQIRLQQFPPAHLTYWWHFTKHWTIRLTD